MTGGRLRRTASIRSRRRRLDEPAGARTRLSRVVAETFRSVHIRSFRLFFIGQFISQTGRWVTMVAQVLLVLDITDSGIALGMLAAAQFGPVLALSPYAGLLADRFDKRNLLLYIQGLAAVAPVGLGALAMADRPPLWGVYALSLIGGVATAFDNPIRSSFVSETVPVEYVTNAVSLNSAVFTASRVMGPALGGFLVVSVGFSWAFWLDALTYLAVIVGLRMIRPDELRSAPMQARGTRQIRAGLRYASSVTDLRVPLVMVAVVGTLAFNNQTLLPLLATRDLGGTNLTFSLLMSVVAMGSLSGALTAGRHPRLSVKGTSASSIAFGVALTLLALSPTLPMAFVFGAIMGHCSSRFMTASRAIVQLRADPAMRGRVLALLTIAFLGSTPIGGPIVGFVAEQAGARWALALGGAAAVGAGIWGGIAARSDGAADRDRLLDDTGVAESRPMGTR